MGSWELEHGQRHNTEPRLEGRQSWHLGPRAQWALSPSDLKGLFFFLRAMPEAYGRSQARGQIGPAAAGLYHSHSNTRSDCDLQQSSRQRRILNPLSRVRDRTLVLVDTSQVHFCCATTGIPQRTFYDLVIRMRTPRLRRTAGLVLLAAAVWRLSSWSPWPLPPQQPCAPCAFYRRLSIFLYLSDVLQ